MSKDKKLGTIVMLAGLSAMIIVIWVAGLFAKDLPVLVPLHEIGRQYDARRVSVFGWVRSVEVKQGRRGSRYVELILGEGDATVTIYSIRPVPNLLNARVIVQGVYKEAGRFGGLLADHFIDAEMIVRDWGGTNKGIE